MADSSEHTSKDNFFLKSWASCETLSPEDADIFCNTCKESLGKFEDNIDLENIVSKTISGQSFNFKSCIYLTCKNCPTVTHLHCADQGGGY